MFLKPSEQLKMGEKIAKAFKELFKRNPRLGDMTVTFAKGRSSVEVARSINNRRMSKPDLSDVNVRGIAKLNGQRVTIYRCDKKNDVCDKKNDVFALVW